MRFVFKNNIFFLAIVLFFIFIFPKNAIAGCCGNMPTVKEGVSTCREMNESDCKGFIVATYNPTLVCDQESGRCRCPKDTLCLQVPFPGAKNIEQTAKNNTEGLLGKYIFAIYQFFIWVAISLAIFMIMLAGFIWLISAGNHGLIGKAKGYITNALYGLIIVLASYLILISINPRLVQNTMPTIPKPPAVATAAGDKCCYNSATMNMKSDIKLIEGQTCQDAFSSLGGTWQDCPAIVMKTKACCRGITTRSLGYGGVSSTSFECRLFDADNDANRKSCVGSVAGVGFLTSNTYINSTSACLSNETCRDVMLGK